RARAAGARRVAMRPAHGSIWRASFVAGIAAGVLGVACSEQKASDGIAKDAERAAESVREDAAELGEAARRGGAAKAVDGVEDAARDAEGAVQDHGALGAAEEAADA